MSLRYSVYGTMVVKGAVEQNGKQAAVLCTMSKRRHGAG